MPEMQRPELGNFMSVICFRYLSHDAEELAGRTVLIDAGRRRGRDVAMESGLAGTNPAPEQLQKALNTLLGTAGTRLCLVKSLAHTSSGGYEIHATECADPTFALGVFIGAISAISGQTMLGKQIDIETALEEAIFQIDPL